MPILSFVVPLLTKYGKYLAIGLAIVLIYVWWSNNIKNNALNEFNQAQMELVIENQKQLAKKLNDIQRIQAEILDNEQQFKERLDKKLSGINNFLSSEEAKRLDRPSSEILKKTLRELAQ